MHPENFREFEDRMEYTLDDIHYVEEFLCVKCPECGETTMRVLTNHSDTYYVHVRDGTNHESYCSTKRGEENIPDALLYTPYEGTLVISLVDAIW